jgi:hypothetical protein
LVLCYWKLGLGFLLGFGQFRVRLFWGWLEVLAIHCLFLEFALEFVVVVFHFDAIVIVASDDF